MVELHTLPETLLTLADLDWEQCFEGRLGFDGRMLPPPRRPAVMDKSGCRWISNLLVFASFNFQRKEMYNIGKTCISN